MNDERVAFVGAGAVGCYFGGMLARAGVSVTLIGRANHIEAIRRDGLFLERADFQEYIPVAASTEIDAIREAGIVFLCVKTTDTETAAAAMASHLAAGALVVSFQNGVDNVERMQRAAGIAALPAVVYVACAMSGPGRLKHNGRGDIVIGGPSSDSERIARLFESARIPCRISRNIDRELWTKLVMNCAYNAISALTHARYRFLTADPAMRDVMKELIREVVAVGIAAGVVLPAVEELAAAAFKLGETMATATSSTEQDITRGRLTEIDSLNGYVARRGKELGISTPVNSTVYALVKFIEQGTA
ncbi:MAG TPA: 2-dehydropantoate 2-reductase [Terriglobia bacterium]